MTMAWTTCPICSHKNPRASSRCTACGADFSDPDVRAMAGDDGPPVGLSPEVGALATARFLGVSLDGLADGSALARLGVAMAVVLGIGFLIPLTADYQQLHFAWSRVGEGPAFALLLPALAATFALLIGVTRAIPAAAGAAALALFGLAGAVSLPTLGKFGGAPEALIPLHHLGLAVAGAALIVRLARPDDRTARLALAAGAALAAVGLFIKLGGGGGLPLELGGASASDAATGKAYLDALKLGAKNAFVLFTAIALFTPALAAAGATVVAWPSTKGPWDRSSLPLRALGWCIVFAPALLAGALAFNMTGWSERGHTLVAGRWVMIEDLMSGAIIGRLRGGVLGSAYLVMAAFGLAAAYLGQRPASAAKPATET